jgi:ribosomal protein L15
MRESYAEKIAPVVAEKWQKLQKEDGQLSERTKEPKAGFRAQVAREEFANLPSAEQKDLADRAKGEAAAAKLEYVTALKGPVATSPEARQK